MASWVRNYTSLALRYFSPGCLLGARLINHSQVVFVDVMDSIIEQLQKTKTYTVTEIGGDGEHVNTITNYRAINSKTHEADVIKEIETADIVRSSQLRKIQIPFS